MLSFRSEYLAPLNTVANIWDDAAHSFINKELEQKRLQFVQAAYDLAMEIAGKTVPEGDYVTVIPRGADPENLEQWVRDDARAIDAKLPVFINAHEELLKLGNKLGISPSGGRGQAASRYAAAPALARNSQSVFAYLQGNARILDLTKALAQRRHLETTRADGENAWLNERLEVFGVKTIRELDHYVELHGEAAGRLSDYWSPQSPIDPGFLLGYIVDIAVIERDGLEGLEKYYQALKYSSNGPGTAEYIFMKYMDVKAS